MTRNAGNQTVQHALFNRTPNFEGSLTFSNCLSDDIPYPCESPFACSFSPAVSASPLGGGGAVDFKDVMTRLQTEALWRGGVETLRKNPGAITNQAFFYFFRHFKKKNSR